MIDAPVVIAAGGPIGMTPAPELASHGVAALLGAYPSVQSAISRRASPVILSRSSMGADGPRGLSTGGAIAASIVARDYNATHLNDRRLQWWHVSGASLFVWLRAKLDLGAGHRSCIRDRASTTLRPSIAGAGSSSTVTLDGTKTCPIGS